MVGVLGSNLGEGRFFLLSGWRTKWKPYCLLPHIVINNYGIVCQDTVVLGVNTHFVYWLGVRGFASARPCSFFPIKSRARKVASLVPSCEEAREEGEIRFETKAAGGRESKVREEMERHTHKDENTRPKEPQSYTLKHSFRTFGDDGQGSWVNVEICGKNEAKKWRRKMVRIKKKSE